VPFRVLCSSSLAISRLTLKRRKYWRVSGSAFSGGRGPELGDNAATLTHGHDGLIHGFKSKVLEAADGVPAPVYSIASGLDYPGVGPEHAFLNKTERTKVATASDVAAITAFYQLSRLEGIIPALESAHAVAFAAQLARERSHDSILINLSGRGDKDIDFVYANYPPAEWAGRKL